MAGQKTVRNRSAGSESLRDDTRELVMETLLQLHIDFVALGSLDEAGPLLQRLMEVAYHSTSAQPVPNAPAGKRQPRPAVN